MLISRLRRKRHGGSEGRHVHRRRASRSISKPAKPACTRRPLIVSDIVIVGSSFKEGMTVVTRNNTKGLVRAFDVRTGKLIWTFHTIPQQGRIRLRHLGERLGRLQRQHRRVDADDRRSGAWLGLSAGGIAHLRLLRRRASGQQSVRRKPGLRRSQDRQAQVVFPDRASSGLGLRSVLGAAPGRHHGGRQARSKRSPCPARKRSCMCSTA